MTTAEEGPGSHPLIVGTEGDAARHGDSPKAEHPGEANVADANGRFSADSSNAANAKCHAIEKQEKLERTDETQSIDDDDGSGSLLRGWSVSRDDVAPSSSTSPIDNKNVDESPYEHNFEPGDHIIRWEMLPILWPIQIHAIVLEISEDRSEVTICDFGITSVKNSKEGEKNAQVGQDENNVEEENTRFNEAIQDECGDELSVSTNPNASTAKNEPMKKQRLTVKKLTKWSDLRKWHKVNYEGGLLNVGRGGVGKGLKNLGKKTEKLWTSMTKSFVKNDVTPPPDIKKAWRSVRYDVDERGFCVHHPHIQLKRLKDNGDWTVVRKKCPECILEDCPAMMGEESHISKEPSIESAPSFSSTEDEHSVSQSRRATPTDTSEKNTEPSIDGNNEFTSESKMEDKSGGVIDGNAGTEPSKPESKEKDVEPKTLSQMISDANEVEKRSRENVAAKSPQRKSIGMQKTSWGGSFMKSLSNIIPNKNWTDGLNNVDSTNEQKTIDSFPGEGGEEISNKEQEQNTLNDLPRSDPPVLVLARTRFILEHGEGILPPYHIVNSNSECIAVWCKTGRWSTLQASVFLHSTAIGNAKSATALTIGVAATQPRLIPAFATVGLAAVGTPWLMLKVANDKWTAATMGLTEKFWMQAQPEVFLECIEKWSNIEIQ